MSKVVNNAFGRLLQEFRGGESLEELSDQLQALVKAVEERGKAGELKYTVRIEPRGGAMVVTDKVEVKLPRSERDQAVFFATEDGVLQRDNPRQRTFELKEVEAPEAGELKEAGRQVVG